MQGEERRKICFGCARKVRKNRHGIGVSLAIVPGENIATEKVLY